MLYATLKSFSRHIIPGHYGSNTENFARDAWHDRHYRHRTLEPMFPIVERLEWLERVSDPADPFGGSEVLDRFEQSETVVRVSFGSNLRVTGPDKCM